MKKLVAITAFTSGVLVLLVPRYILPACEYEGYPHMHCSDTARAEYIVGILLMVSGSATFFAKTTNQVLAGAVVSFILSVTAFWLPGKIGYCQSPRMPCNYGMVPGVRFTATVCLLILLVAIIKLTISHRKTRIP